MVLFLNYLPWIIVALGVFAFIKSLNLPVEHPRRKKYLIGSVVVPVVLFMVLNSLTAGYIPKQRSSEVGIGSPPFEPTDAQIENRLRKPVMTAEEGQAHLNELTDWRQHKRDEAAKDKAAKEVQAPAE